MPKLNQIRNILVLDDEPDTASTFEMALKKNGYDVVAFTSPRQAFDYLARYPNKFDLVISDIKMPFMDGIEFAKKVKQQLPSLGIVLVTAFEVDRSESTNLESLDIRELVRKPISMPQLLAIVARHVRTKDENLDRLYCCQSCKSSFLFASDVREHEELAGHLSYKEIPL